MYIYKIISINIKILCYWYIIHIDPFLLHQMFSVLFSSGTHGCILHQFGEAQRSPGGAFLQQGLGGRWRNPRPLTRQRGEEDLAEATRLGCFFGDFLGIQKGLKASKIQQRHMIHVGYWWFRLVSGCFWEISIELLLAFGIHHPVGELQHD